MAGIVSAIRNQREINAGAPSAFCFLFSLSPQPRDDAVQMQSGSFFLS